MRLLVYLPPLASEEAVVTVRLARRPSWWAPSLGEEFVASGEATAAGEEAIFAVAVRAPGPWIPRVSTGEEFQGARPLEEAYAFSPKLRPRAVFFFRVSPEEPAVSHPQEELASAPPRFRRRLAVAILLPEDFAGSLPLEEPKADAAKPRSKTIVPLVFRASEEPAVAHPQEENASDPPRLSSRRRLSAVFSLPEDFAGSLPLEEPKAETARPRPRAVVPLVFRASEEPSTTHPQEESAAPLGKQPKRSLYVATLLPEDFAGSLPLEEPAFAPKAPSRRAATQPYNVPEPSVTPGPLAETSPVLDLPGDRSWTLVASDTSEPFPEPEPPPPPPPPEPTQARRFVAVPAGSRLGPRRKRPPEAFPVFTEKSAAAFGALGISTRATASRRRFAPGIVSFGEPSLVAAGVSTRSAWPWIAAGAAAGVLFTVLFTRNQERRRRRAA